MDNSTPTLANAKRARRNGFLMLAAAVASAAIAMYAFYTADQNPGGPLALGRALLVLTAVSIMAACQYQSVEMLAYARRAARTARR